MSSSVLFKQPSAPWPLFRPINDTIRGGSSTSSWLLKADLVQFSGHLDIKTLGGAGFASQATTFTPPLNLSHGHPTSLGAASQKSTGLILDLVLPPSPSPTAPVTANTPTSFVLTLKNVYPADRSDGRKESVTNFEFGWNMSDLTALGNEKVAEKMQATTVQVRAAWDDFKPTFRGREDKTSGIKIDPKAITELSFMCRSQFGAQEGDYSLVISSLSIDYSPQLESAITLPSGTPTLGSKEYKSWTSYFQLAFDSLLGVFVGVWGYVTRSSSRGSVRLP